MGIWFNVNYMVFLCFPWTPTNFHESGPPITDEVCDGMVPNHNPHDPVNDIEFIYSEDICYNPGSSVNVTISKVGNAEVGYVFNGIMIQAKISGVEDKNYGSFDAIDSKRFKAAACFRKQKSALHQITRLNQTNLTFYWTAQTGDNVGDLEFHVTVVFTARLSKSDLKIPLPLCKEASRVTTISNSTEGYEISKATTAPTTFNPSTTLELITSTQTTPTTQATTTTQTTPTTQTITTTQTTLTTTATATSSIRTTVRKFNGEESTTRSEKYSMPSLSLKNSAAKIRQPYIVGSLSPTLLVLSLCSNSLSKLYWSPYKCCC